MLPAAETHAVYPACTAPCSETRSNALGNVTEKLYLTGRCLHVPNVRGASRQHVCETGARGHVGLLNLCIPVSVGHVCKTQVQTVLYLTICNKHSSNDTSHFTHAALEQIRNMVLYVY